MITCFFDDDGVLKKAPDYSVTVYFDTEAERDKWAAEQKERAKYRWHDLRKNPEDLPEINHRVELILNYENQNINNMGTRVTHTSWAVNGFITPLKVIAWREIEPFEEET